MTHATSAAEGLRALQWRGWVVLDDQQLPGRDAASVDHVLVGPGGVFVVSRLRWPGPLTIEDGAFRLAGRSAERHVSDVARAAGAVLALMPDVPVTPVLCLERHEPVTGWSRNVMLCATGNAEEVLTSRPVVLGPAQVQAVADLLAARLRPVPATSVSAVEPERRPLPRVVELLLQVLVLALAALLVIGVLRTGVVDEIAARFSGVVTDVSDPADDQPRRKPTDRVDRVDQADRQQVDPTKRDRR